MEMADRKEITGKTKFFDWMFNDVGCLIINIKRPYKQKFSHSLEAGEDVIVDVDKYGHVKSIEIINLNAKYCGRCGRKF